MKIIENNYDAKTFTDLRLQVKFRKYELDDNLKALKQSLYHVIIYNDQGKGIACARVVGDGITTFFIKDVIVTKEFQKTGYGDILMKYVESYITRVGCQGAYVGLMATLGSETFYQKRGYNIRPNQWQGPGMHKYIL